MKYLYIILTAIVPISALAGNVYKWVDEQGKVHYGDKPRKGSERIKLRKPSEYAAREPATTDVDESLSTSAQFSLKVASPQAHQTVRSADGKVAVNITVNPVPDVKLGVKYRLYLDGKSVEGESTRMDFQLTGINRGSHSIRAVMVDKQGKLLAKSAEISFYLRKPELKKASSVSDGNSSSVDYQSTNSASSETYTPGTGNYTSTNKASSTTYRPNYSSRNFKAQ